MSAHNLTTLERDYWQCLAFVYHMCVQEEHALDHGDGMSTIQHDL